MLRSHPEFAIYAYPNQHIVTDTALLSPQTGPAPSSSSRDDRFRLLRSRLIADGLADEHQPIPWRLAPHPFPLSPQEVEWFHDLGQHLLIFYQALNRLYLESVKGTQPSWVHHYLDQGKPEALVTFARMNRFRHLLPDVIRPDVIPTEHGMMITELDSVPGGIGLTGSLSAAYAGAGSAVLGGPEGMVQGFAAMISHRLGDRPPRVAIVVSDEADSYRREMQWVAAQLAIQGIDAACLHPKELRFTEEGMLAPGYFDTQIISLIYRFFELFDLPNIPKAELIMYSAKKGRTLVTPPFKPWFEEKLAFALFHHPVMAAFWRNTLPEGTHRLLQSVLPHTWVLDPRPLPPAAIIPDLQVGGQAVTDFRQLAQGTQKNRRFVIKPSGFSALAWGSRGVAIGHDLPQAKWAASLQTALDSFGTTPSILQNFHKGRTFPLEYYDEATATWQSFEGRARLSPYYFVQDEQAKLGGILATICPKDKKIIHGMRDAVMIPCQAQPTPVQMKS